MSFFSRYRAAFFFGIVLLISAAGLCVFSFLFVAPPALSHSSGFYEESFQLTISVPLHSEVYYTLDGSVPDRSSMRYTEPITVIDSSVNSNTNSMRMDLSAGLRLDLIEKYRPNDSKYTFQPPDYLLDKCTVLRAVAINPFGISSEIISASYFVEIPPERYEGCNIISLVTDPDNLFDPETGIYVTCNIFEEYMATKTPNKNWRFWNANYRQRGSAWEREATFHFFDKNGQFFLEEEGGIRIRGGVSRSTLPRSLNLFARDEHHQSDTFGIPLFGNDYIPAAVTLSSGGNQLITQFNDYMMTQRVRDLNMATTLFEPYVLFLDGEYWGFYWMTEKFGEDYFAHYYDIDPNNCVVVKNNALEIGRTGDFDLYSSMAEFITTNDMSLPENYAKACDLIDIDSYLDYYCTMAYIARDEDWPHNNWSAWRTRLPENSPWGDTKWRWILFDCNSTCMSSFRDTTDQDAMSVLLTDSLFASLWNNPAFREAFQTQILEIADTNFNAREMDQFIQNYVEQMEPALAQSWKRFYGSNNDQQTEFHTRMERIRQFFLNRKSYVESWFPETAK